MPATAETSRIVERRVRGGSWEIKGTPEEIAWTVLETFPKEVDVIRTEAKFTLGFDYARSSVNQALETGVIPGTSMIWSYEDSRKVVKPDRIEFYNGAPSGGSYWINGGDREEVENKYKEEADLLKQVGRAALTGRINAHSFDLGSGGLNALREQQLDLLKAGGYKISNLSLWLSQYRFTGYNEGVNMASGINLRSNGTLEFYIPQNHLVPHYKGGSPELSMADAVASKDWFFDLGVKIKSPAKSTER